MRALDGLSVRLTSPATGLLGANGAGKSTLMRAALGLIPVDSGSLRVLGLDARRQRRELRRRIGFMPEHACLPVDMSAQDLCVHLARLRGLGRRDAVRRASEVLFAVGLEEERRRPVGTYSLGMRQRTKLAQALVHGPDLVLLDEPTSGLDPAGRAEMLSIVRHLSRDLGVHVVTSSHVLDDIERTCDEVVVVHAGRLAAQRPVVLAPRRGGPVALRVTGDLAAFAAVLAQRLEAVGERVVLAPREDGDIGLDRSSDRVLDLVRDLAAERRVGLLRLSSEDAGLEETVVAAMATTAGAGVPALPEPGRPGGQEAVVRR
ncbi:ABC-2 type transport system ATP-binding protein [Kineococcus xinjiangensis]|uniref:ABC-2 type transport system ATP-binding protein n=1 Tax=Kineococcus xinjiangensis TaxID=512762 RepID=A0A2S6IU35_9ACTN|nr:ABC-2 type transport system ATP-binding protein [Kineococcus xinjiangensis]